MIIEHQFYHVKRATELHIQFSRRDALHYVHHRPWGITRRSADKQVHMVNLQCQRFYLPVSPCTDFSNQIVHPLRHFFPQYRPTVARYPHKVVCQSVSCVSSSSSSHLGLDRRRTRSRAPLRGAHNADRLRQRTYAPAFGGPPFLPTPRGGVSRRRIS